MEIQGKESLMMRRKGERMKNRITAVLLTIVMILSLIPVQGMKTYAYGKDYNFIDNVINEVGYGQIYNDAKQIKESNFMYSLKTRGETYEYWYSDSISLNGKNVVVPMTKNEYCSDWHNVKWAVSHFGIDVDGMDWKQTVTAAASKLSEYYDDNLSYKTLYLTSSSNLQYDPKDSYFSSIKTVKGSDVCIASIANVDIKAVALTVQNEANIADYCFAYNTSLKDITVLTQASGVVFPYAFAYGCTALKYLTYEDSKAGGVTFKDYAFAKCSALIHWTGMGQDGATNNWNNSTSQISSLTVGKYAFSNCQAITHSDFVSPNVVLDEYAFGNTGLTYIGFYDYVYSDAAESKFLGNYTLYATSEMTGNKLSDKAFDGVSATRVYVAHKNIYNAFDSFCDGKLFGRTLCVANIAISYDGTDSDGGSVDNVNIRYDDDSYVMENHYTKTGYDFSYWDSLYNNLDDKYNAPHAGTDWVSALYGSEKVKYLGEITVTPAWKAKEFGLSYVLNGGDDSGIDLPKVHTYGQAISTLPNPARVAYDFLGWYEDEQCTKPFGGIVAEDMKEHTYYAKWSAHDITITYVLNGGKNNDGNPNVLSSDSGRFDLLPATREGYAFLGWYQVNGTSSGDEEVTHIMPSMGDLTLEAKWKKQEFPINYVLNGGDDSDIELPKAHIYGEVITELPEPKRAGYDFLGWYEDKDFAIPFSGITAKDNKKHTYYARWAAHQQKITYELNGGVNDINNPNTLEPNAKRFDLLPATREGYEFLGWFMEDMSTKVEYITPAMGDLVLHASWSAFTYPIHYELNGGDDSDIELPQVHVYGETITSLPEPKRHGYDFRGWYEDKYFTEEFNGITAIDTKEYTYYAKWEFHKIAITYELDGGKNNPDNPGVLEYDGDKIYLKPAAKDGYDFVRWYEYEDSDRMVTVEFIMPADGDRTLYAEYTPHTYKIKYETDGGEFVGTPVTEHTYGKMTYLVTPIKKDKFYFEGWYKDKELKERVFDLPPEYWGDVTLYAKWAETVANLKVPDKKGYRFIGWVTKKGTEIKLTEPVYAHEHDIYANYLDIRWTEEKKGTKTYINSLKADYDFFKKKDIASQYDMTEDESIKVFGAVNGLVTKEKVKINIEGAVKSVSLACNGKKIELDGSYFNKKSNGEYFKGYTCKKAGIYTLSVTSQTTGKTLNIKYMIDSVAPVVKGIVNKEVITKTVTKKEAVKETQKKSDKTKKTKKTKKKGSTTTTTTTTTKYRDNSLIGLWKQTVKEKKVVKKVSTFKITQQRRFYIHTDKDEHKTDNKAVTNTEKITGAIKWSDSPVGVSSVYINGKALTKKKVKKGSYLFKKAGRYKVEVYDYLGNKFSQTIVVDNENSDVKLPSLNMKNGATYYVGAKLTANDESGIENIKITDWHGFTKTYKKSSYIFKKSGTYTIKVTDKVGNYKKIKIKIVKKPKY